jgi:hypothetical protein
MREAIRGDEGDNQCPRVPGRSRQGAGVFPWVFQGLSRAWDGAWIPCRVSCRQSEESASSHVSLQKCEHKHALAHGGTLAAGTAQARRERTGNGMCSPGTGSTKGSAALRRDSTQTSLSRHMSCTRKQRGAQPAPGDQRLPEPPIDAAASLSSCAACVHLP